jgi:AraC-like DNA-binding protein
MIIVPRPYVPDEWLPRTIRHTSDGAQFGGMRMLVREIPAAQQLEVPGVLSQFWMGYRPTPEEPGRMVFTCQHTDHAFVAEHNPIFMGPGTLYTVEWQEAEGLVADFNFHPAFLEDVAALLRLDPGSLYRTSMQKVSIDEPLESLCRLLMQEVEQGCPHGSAFFEPLSRALAVALVRRVAVARPVAGRDWRIERAVRLFKQQHRQTVSMEEAVRATGLSRYQFFRRFRAAMGISPYQYLLHCRLDHARQLILSDGHRRSLADIATEAGFYDQAHLCRHFRRVFGQSPGHLLRPH